MKTRLCLRCYHSPWQNNFVACCTTLEYLLSQGQIRFTFPVNHEKHLSVLSSVYKCSDLKPKHIHYLPEPRNSNPHLVSQGCVETSSRFERGSGCMLRAGGWTRWNAEVTSNLNDRMILRSKQHVATFWTMWNGDFPAKLAIMLRWPHDVKPYFRFLLDLKLGRQLLR